MVTNKVVCMRMFSALVCAWGLHGCAPATIEPTAEELALAGTQPMTRRVRGVFEIEIQPEDDVPQGDPWHAWLALPRDTMPQCVVGGVALDPSPTDIQIDSEHGNTIAHWNFGEKRRLALRGEFTLDVQNVFTTIDDANIGEYDTESGEYRLYTRSEYTIAVTDEIRAIAEEIRANCSAPENPYALTRRAFQWILDRMYYVYPVPHDPNTAAILADRQVYDGQVYYRGDCGSYSILYNAILRALGIPARMVVGGWSLGEDMWHVWSEVLIPGHGWIPVDTSAADTYVYDEGAELNALGAKYFGGAPWTNDPFFFFGNMDPFRFVLSIGTDISIQPTVNWDLSPYEADFLYHEGRATIIQGPIYHAGLKASGRIRFFRAE